MPSDYTKNYHLNQWEPEDKVLRTDFNADNLKIEDALSALAAADQTEIDARTAAISSINSTLNAKGNCTISAFTYTGNGNYGKDNPTKVTFSKVPAAFIIYGDDILVGRGGVTAVGHIYSISTGGAGVGGNVVSWSGGTMSMYNTSSAARQLNRPNTTYHVIAFYT